jgi:hypothetical protein
MSFSLFEHFSPSIEWTWSQEHMTLMTTVFWNVMPCSLLERWKWFGRTLGTVYQTTWYTIPENANDQSHCCENLTTHIRTLSQTRTHARAHARTRARTHRKKCRKCMIYSIPNFKCPVTCYMPDIFCPMFMPRLLRVRRCSRYEADLLGRTAAL